MSKAPEPQNEDHLDPKAQSAHQDDLIVVPKGRRRTRFVMTFLIVVLVLTTFTVSDQVLNVFGAGTEVRPAMTWTAADGTKRSLSEQEFLLEKRKIAPLAGYVFSTRERDPGDEQVATFLILEDAAAHAGIRATDNDVAKFVKDEFQSKEQYQSFLRLYAITGKEFEGTIRRAIRFKRYLALISAAAAVPDAQAVEKRWKAQHQEYAFDYVELPVSSVEAEARALAPDEAGLRAWYENLAEGEKAAFKTKELVSAELAAFPLEAEFDAASLFAKYPRPADEDVETKAQEFHSGFSYVLYRREQVTQGQDFRLSFEEAKERALRDAPIYHSLMDWRASLAERAARGETPDFAAEAAELGLTYRNQIDPISADAWRDLTVPWVSSYVISRLFSADQQPGVFPAVVVEAKGFVLGVVHTKVPARQPDYEDVKAAVLDAWARNKAKEVAIAKLEAVRDALGTRPDPNDANAPPFRPEATHEAFVKAVTDAGLTPQRREWAEQNAPPPPEGDTAASMHFRLSSLLYTQKEGAVTKPELNRAGDTAFLVRLDGVRDADVARITPADVQSIGMQLSNQERSTFLQTALVSRDALKARFGLEMSIWRDEAEQQQP